MFNEPPKSSKIAAYENFQFSWPQNSENFEGFLGVRKMQSMQKSSIFAVTKF